MKYRNTIILFVITSLLIASCGKNNDHDNTEQTGKIVFEFEHFVNGAALILDEMNYVNAAGNQYEVSEVQWFVSDITLNKPDGSELLLDDEKIAHYIDTNLPETGTWNVADEIPANEYSSISIVFGIKGEKNKPYAFTDTPESNMLWPITLGGEQGGYHYMKLNGFWINKDDQRAPFNFHLGVGQERDADNNITGFVQNWFEVELPSSSFVVNPGEVKKIAIRMNIEKWWDSPNIYNHDEIGGKIMQNQEAMRMGVENGKSVFSIGSMSTIVD